MTCDPPAPISSPISVRCAAAVRVWGRLSFGGSSYPGLLGSDFSVGPATP